MKPVLSVLFLILCLSAPMARSYAAGPPFEFRDVFSDSTLMSEYSDTVEECSTGLEGFLLETCGSLYAALAIGHYERGQMSKAAENARLLLQYQLVTSGDSPCPTKQYWYGNVDGSLVVGAYQLLYEVMKDKKNSEVIDLGFRAFMCEALTTDGYHSQTEWSNLDGERLDGPHFTSFVGSVFGEEGERQVEVFLSDIIGPLGAVKTEVWDSSSSTDEARSHVTEATSFAVLFRNAEGYAAELELDSRFVKMLSDFATWYEWVAEYWSGQIN